MEKVADRIYETNKMKVELYENYVYKIFKKKQNSRHSTRYYREKKALKLLSQYSYFPILLDFDDDKHILKISRLKGKQIQTLSIHQVNLLRDMVEKMLQTGVARHALPIRDFVAPDEHNLGMVDFERITFRNFSLSPFWLIAKKVTYYHLCRQIYQHQPQLLSESEKKYYLKVEQIRSLLQKLKPLRKKFKSLFKQNSATVSNIFERF